MIKNQKQRENIEIREICT